MDFHVTFVCSSDGSVDFNGDMLEVFGSGGDDRGDGALRLASDLAADGLAANCHILLTDRADLTHKHSPLNVSTKTRTWTQKSLTKLSSNIT